MLVNASVYQSFTRTGKNTIFLNQLKTLKNKDLFDLQLTEIGFNFIYFYYVWEQYLSPEFLLVINSVFKV
jgi:hypothetical protein